MIRRQNKKIRYSQKCFCDECEKIVEVEVTYIVLDSATMNGMIYNSFKCSQGSCFPYLCKKVDDCVIVQEIRDEVESNSGNF